ncbi:LEC14B homolog [Salvia hispanica]|uniref:LEC14B homolog n=1 Tax=Salvia hispanica TaxID=49212 RepID=UPI0020097ADD|nr:LEC14B homolog [Salvia hispanica]XP_047982023.1 LEC14B homolog [Salvia hispanica]XP_047982024.1 LEC14B homolog [Salvia hispanica]
MSRVRGYINPGVGFDEYAESCGYVRIGCADDEFAQVTKLRSAPHKHLRHVLPGESTAPLVSPVQMMMGRECNYSGKGRFSTSDSCHVLSRYLPVRSTPSVVDKMTSCAYVSQFSDDGSLFVAGFQESHIKIYDVDHGWKVHKDIYARSLRWTITDTSLSPDRRFLVYSSISPVVHIVDVGSGTKQSLANVTEIHEGLEFSSNVDDYENYSFGIFSVKFSTDGREIVAASSDDAIYVYDLEARKLSLRIPAHRADVNSVCFADESGNIIYSGSDDRLCKVWDRRCLATKGQAAGVLMGHLEGITFIDTRGDGRYFISNGKDQSIKLWDIRKMSSNVNYVPRRRYSEWDYRWMEYPEQARNLKLRDDLSIATYKGHTVLRTLIRCYFSPAFSTGQRYIYTGSTDSCVYVYDVLSGDLVAKLDYHEDPVRDCNWHPFYPMLVSSSWDGMVARWEFPDNGKTTSPAVPVRRRRRFFY